MAADPSQIQQSLETSWFRASYRSWPEQFVGLGIYLLISLGIDLIHRRLLSFSAHTGWFANLSRLPWAIENWPQSPFITATFFCLSLAMWGLWRRMSLRRLKLEVSLFLAIGLLLLFWSGSFFALQATLLSLVSVLLGLSALLVTAILFWKKERAVTPLFALPLLWVFYLTTLTMIVCTVGHGS